MTPRQPLGMTPSALALSPDGKRLFVACSDANVAAVVDVSEARSRVEGFIPTGWYPTAVRALPSGTLVVLNGKGLRSYPNPERPQPRASSPSRCMPAYPRTRQYVGRMQTGTASWIEPFTVDQLEDLDRTTRHRQLALSRREAGPAQPAPAHRARHLHRQGESHLRPGAGRHEGRQRRSVAGPVRRKRHAQPAQAGARVRAARQFLRQRRRQRRRPQLVHRGHRARLRAEDVAQQLRQPPQALTTSKSRTPPRCLPPATSGPTPPQAGVSMRNFGYMVDNKPNAAARRRTDHRVRDPVLAKSPTASIAASTSTIPTWSAPRCSSPTWRSTRSPATCRA